MPEIIYQWVGPEEIEAIISLHRETFAVAYVDRTIFSTHGIGNYMVNLIVLPALQNEHILLGAWDHKKLVGYVYCRALESSWHLNYIAVAKSYQGQGIGRTLFESWLDLGRRRKYRFFSLDVEASNQKTVDWYSRCGFKTIKKIEVYEKSIRQQSSASHEYLDIQLHDWESAEAWQALYGFSEFSLRYQNRLWSIGRIGNKYFRVKEILPQVLEEVLAYIDSYRHLLLFSEQSIAYSEFSLVGTSLRMIYDMSGSKIG